MYTLINDTAQLSCTSSGALEPGRQSTIKTVTKTDSDGVASPYFLGYIHTYLQRELPRVSPRSLKAAYCLRLRPLPFARLLIAKLNGPLSRAAKRQQRRVD